MAQAPTHQQIQALLDVLYEHYEQKKTFHPVDTATVLAEMFRVQRGLTKEAIEGTPLDEESMDTLTEDLINMSRVVDGGDPVNDILCDMQRLV